MAWWWPSLVLRFLNFSHTYYFVSSNMIQTSPNMKNRPCMRASYTGSHAFEHRENECLNCSRFEILNGVGVKHINGLQRLWNDVNLKLWDADICEIKDKKPRVYRSFIKKLKDITHVLLFSAKSVCKCLHWCLTMLSVFCILCYLWLYTELVRSSWIVEIYSIFHSAFSFQWLFSLHEFLRSNTRYTPKGSRRIYSS